jgi:hypothetical protein
VCDFYWRRRPGRRCGYFVGTVEDDEAAGGGFDFVGIISRGN